MFKNLGKIITVLNVIGFILVMLVGGTSIFLSNHIFKNGHKIEHISLEINDIDNMRTDALRILHHIHSFFINQEEVYSNHANRTVANIRKQVYEYNKHKHEKHRIKTVKELRLFEIITGNVEKLVIVSKILEDFSMSRILDNEKLRFLEALTYEIEATAITINKMHLNQIAAWEKDSMETMWQILILYLIFMLGGGVSVIVGHRLLTKKVAKPIMEVATATLEFSKGTYNKRVHTDSKTEIGKLYQSFNEMAEKLQQNDELLRKFNETLENKVKERTTALEKAHEKIRRTEKIAAVGQIAAGVTHEIRHPLNSLSLSAHELSKEIADSLGTESSAYKSARLFNFEINRINNILEEFINFAKFPESKFFENNINDVVNEVAELMTENLNEKGIRINLFLDNNISDINFDARQFKEVLINLFENACKASKNGDSIEVKTVMSEDRVTIRISDTGSGISDKLREKIFSPFFSTNENGLGLGLPIVQKIIESHGGTLTFKSRIGEGTEFAITLPMKNAGVLI